MKVAVFLVDRTASTAPIRHAFVDGINAFAARHTGSDTIIEVRAFSDWTDVATPIRVAKAAEFTPLTADDLELRRVDGTATLDALLTLHTQLVKYYTSSDRLGVFVLTDGHNNASKHALAGLWAAMKPWKTLPWVVWYFTTQFAEHGQFLSVDPYRCMVFEGTEAKTRTLFDTVIEDVWTRFEQASFPSLAVVQSRLGKEERRSLMYPSADVMKAYLASLPD